MKRTTGMRIRTLGMGLAAVTAAVAIGGCSDRAPEASPATAITISATQAPQTAATTTQQAARTAAASTTGELAVTEIVRLAEPAIVRIETGGGVGTGFIVSADGYLVTNNHVVEGANGVAARTVNVTLSDGDRIPGTVVGTDPRSDLALVKIDGGPYSPLPLGRLDEVEIGQSVVAIGYALDLSRGEGPSFTVTTGIVSQKNRAISESAPILGAIQTDAAINHGNSGGPLINLFGEVVGVNTALAPDPTTGGVAQGIGFAVGVDTVQAVWEQLRDTGRVERGFLGISGFTALRPAVARDLGIPEDVGGIYLAAGDAVQLNGPAGAAGIRSGDVITAIGTSKIATEADLAVAMIRNGPGSTVAVEIYRGSEKMTVDLTLGTPPTQ
ncbi:MAG: S1C family serine protease [Dehalococcoidia bacterium]